MLQLFSKARACLHILVAGKELGVVYLLKPIGQVGQIFREREADGVLALIEAATQAGRS